MLNNLKVRVIGQEIQIEILPSQGECNGSVHHFSKLLNADEASLPIIYQEALALNFGYLSIQSIIPGVSTEDIHIELPFHLSLFVSRISHRTNTLSKLLEFIENSFVYGI